MRDVDLYRQVLGLEEPWFVGRVELSAKEQQVDVWVEHIDGHLFRCSECDYDAPAYDHAGERVWRHLDTCQFKTLLHGSIPRIKCPKHGVKQVRVPWAEPHSRFTMLFERLAIDLLLECTIYATASILRLSWDEAEGIMDRAVKRGLARKEERSYEHLGVDEKAFLKGHRYATIVCDMKESTVEYVGRDRTRATLDNFYNTLSYEQLSGVTAVAMDMWEPFANSTREHVPDASGKIVFDRFHISKHLLEAVDKVRRRENKELVVAGDGSLKGTKYLWLYSLENLPDKHRPAFEDLRSRDLKTARAWAIKENLREFWAQGSLEEARSFWKRWYFWATHSRLDPIRDVANMIKRHLDNVLTYFTHRITNATAEGLNSKIQAVKLKARGFRRFESFVRAIYFHCGGLALYPTHEVSGMVMGVWNGIGRAYLVRILSIQD